MRLFFVREEVAPDSTKEGPLCMNQYARLFAHARIPARSRDLLVRRADETACMEGNKATSFGQLG